MSFLSRLLPQEQRSVDPEKRMLVNSSFVAPPFEGIGSDLVGEMRAMQSSTVFACVRLLSDVIASMPWYVYKRDKNNVPRRIYPGLQVIRQPCVDMDLFEWVWMVVSTLALRGNSYHLIVGRDANGNPTGLMPIHPDLVFLERRVNVLEWYDPIYRVLGERVPREDIIHIRRFTLAGEPYGLSPLKMAARTISTDIAAAEYGNRYFKDSANPSGLLTTPQDMTPEEVEQNQAEWLANHQGRRFPAILTGGLDFKPLSIAPDEAQFLETRGFQVGDIARFYGVPPHLVGDQEQATAWGTGIESMNLGFHAYSIAGWTRCIESAISNHLPRGQVVQFDPSVLLRGDVKTRLESYNLGRQAGLYSANDIRAKEELPPIPNGDGYLQPLNFVELGAEPEVTPMPKVVGAVTEPGATPPKLAKGQEPEPPGIGSRKFRRSQVTIQQGPDGRPKYFNSRTGETVTLQEVIDD